MTELEEKYSLLQLYYTPEHVFPVTGRSAGMLCTNTAMMVNYQSKKERRPKSWQNRLNSSLIHSF